MRALLLLITLAALTSASAKTPPLAVWSGALDVEACGGNSVEITALGDEIAGADYFVEGSASAVRHLYYFQNGKPVFFLEAKYSITPVATKDPNDPDNRKTTLVQYTPSAFDSLPAEKQKELLTEIALIRKSFQDRKNWTRLE
ncbi:MAG: hypothetical protein ABI615_06190 [Chthoniobacterales bacterium]